jgi:hypothetical protein
MVRCNGSGRWALRAFDGIMALGWSKDVRTCIEGFSRVPGRPLPPWRERGLRLAMRVPAAARRLERAMDDALCRCPA